MPGSDLAPRRPLCVLVVHERYRVRGGEDGVFETECSLLEKAGHKVVRYEKDNREIPDRGGRIGLALRTVWNPRTYREIRAIIRAEKPDVVHCHNTFPLISPSVYWAAAREAIRFAYAGTGPFTGKIPPFGFHGAAAFRALHAAGKIL